MLKKLLYWNIVCALSVAASVGGVADTKFHRIRANPSKNEQHLVGQYLSCGRTHGRNNAAFSTPTKTTCTFTMGILHDREEEHWSINLASPYSYCTEYISFYLTTYLICTIPILIENSSRTNSYEHLQRQSLNR